MTENALHMLRRYARNRQEVSINVGPGRYVIERTFVCDDRIFHRAIQCANPVYGYRQLDDWEATVLLRAVNRREMKAA